MARAGTLILVLAGVILAALFGACGTDAVGVESCRLIEGARCAQAPHCPAINLGIPPHRGSPTTDVEMCQQFYDVACLHGLEVSADPGAPAVSACVKAINTGDCNIVLHPESDPACAWLIPPAPPVPDAGDGATCDAPDETGSCPVEAGTD